LPFMQTFYHTLATAGHSFLSWVSDDYSAMRASSKQTFPNKGRLLIDFESASLVALAYVVLVSYGLIKKPSAAASATRASSSSTPASSASGGQKEEAKGALHYFKCVYNLTQVALCGWLMYWAARIQLQSMNSSGSSKLFCLPFSFNPVAKVPASVMQPDLAYIVWVFYLSKVLDFFDTIFIIAGRKWEQLSFLHYYHHVTIYLVYWMNANVGADGDIYLTVVLNCFVHCVMYFYYFVTATDFLGLKKLFFKYKLAVTAIQMIQFICMVGQGFAILYDPVTCRFPRRVTAIYVPYIISLFILFANFMIGTAKKRTTSTAPSKQQPAAAAKKGQ